MMNLINKNVEIKKNNFRRKIVSVFVMLCVTSQFLQAQEEDFTSWLNAGFEYKVKPAFVISTDLEWRTKNDLNRTDRWGIGVGGEYLFLPFLKFGAGYELHYRNRGESGWEFRHRYRVDGTLSTHLQHLKLSLWERLQHTFDGENDEFRLRSRFKLAYDIPKCKLEPYVSVEIYNGLNFGEHFNVQRMRYRTGLSFEVTDNWDTEVFYCRQWQRDRQKNIVGIECSYSF